MSHVRTSHECPLYKRGTRRKDSGHGMKLVTASLRTATPVGTDTRCDRVMRVDTAAVPEGQLKARADGRTPLTGWVHSDSTSSVSRSGLTGDGDFQR